MVAFCSKCNHSLPFADVYIVDGEERPLPEYDCPHCGEDAGEEPDISKDEQDVQRVIIQDGEESKSTEM